VATTNDLKNGMVLNLDGQLWSVVEFQHVKPGKGGAFVRTKLKNVLSGKVVDKTFNAGTKVDTATVDKRDMQFLYKEGADFVFMDMQSYDQIHVPAETVGDDTLHELDGVLPHRRVGCGDPGGERVEHRGGALLGLEQHVERPLAGLAAGTHAKPQEPVTRPR